MRNERCCYRFIFIVHSMIKFKQNQQLQVNLCQKLLFLHQTTHNMTTDCSLNYKFNTWKFQAQTLGEHAVCRNCFWHSEQFLYTTCSPRFELGIFMYWTCNSMSNLSSYCGLVDAKIRASDKGLPVLLSPRIVEVLLCTWIVQTLVILNM